MKTLAYQMTLNQWHVDNVQLDCGRQFDGSKFQLAEMVALCACLAAPLIHVAAALLVLNHPPICTPGWPKPPPVLAPILFEGLSFSISSIRATIEQTTASAMRRPMIDRHLEPHKQGLKAPT